MVNIILPIAGRLVSTIGRHLGYPFYYHSNVEDLKNQLEKLGRVRGRMERSVDAARRNGDEIEPDVEDWLKSVNGITEEASKIFDDEDLAKKRCFNGLCPNLKSRYQLSKKAKKKKQEVVRIQDDGKFDKVSYPPPLPPPNMVLPWEVDSPSMEKFIQEMATEKPVRFTAQELCSFTSNYSKRLGSGGFGVVYEGQFLNGVKIAVKVLNGSLDKRAEDQFMAEVGTIGRTYHKNLVKLYGYCYEHSMRALVYEYMENGSLDKYLFSKTQSIEWEKLHDIAIGIAKGIAYLHEECEQRIIHYDIKPGNVLLDANFFPKVADFGLAKLCNRDNTHVSITGYRGTPGYSALELMLQNYPITHKCDVYSFGMLMFEIVGRRRNANVGSSDSIDWLPKQVWDEYEKGVLSAMTVAYGIEEKDGEKAMRMSMVALWCVQDSPRARPLMSDVVKMLEGGVEIMPPPKPFHYLYTLAIDVIKPPETDTDLSSLKSGESNSQYWYKESTPIMTNYEINSNG